MDDTERMNHRDAAIALAWDTFNDDDISPSACFDGS